MTEETQIKNYVYAYLIKQNRKGEYITVLHLNIMEYPDLKDICFQDSINKFAILVCTKLRNILCSTKYISKDDSNLAKNRLDQVYYDKHDVDKRYIYTLKEDSNFILSVEITFLTPDSYSQLTKEFISIPFSELNKY